MIPQQIYSQFKKWLRGKAWWGFLPPQNSEKLVNDPNFRIFLRETGLESNFPSTSPGVPATPSFDTGRFFGPGFTPEGGVPDVPKPGDEDWAQFLRQAQNIASATGMDLAEVIRQLRGLTIPEEKDKGLTEFQQAQLTLNQQQLIQDWILSSKSQELAERKLREEEAQRLTEQTVRSLQPQGFDSEREFERGRQAIVAQLKDSPRDWIKLKEWVNQINPFTPRVSEFEGAKTRVADAMSILKTAEAIQKMAASDPNRSLSDTEWTLIQNAKENVYKADVELLAANAAVTRGVDRARAGLPPPGGVTNIEQQLELEGYRKGAAQMGMAFGTEGTDSAPVKQIQTPDWLASMTGLKTVPHEKSTEITTPSMQQWTRLSPTQRQEFAGLVDWAGTQTTEDLASRMTGSLTRPPSLGRTWKPATQWA